MLDRFIYIHLFGFVIPPVVCVVLGYTVYLCLAYHVQTLGILSVHKVYTILAKQSMSAAMSLISEYSFNTSYHNSERAKAGHSKAK